MHLNYFHFLEGCIHLAICMQLLLQGMSWRDDEIFEYTEPSLGLGKISEQKGILGPGPADLRFPEAL